MKRVAIMFLVAVFVPSLVLAWLAVRSVSDQQLILERQQSLLYQSLADHLVQDLRGVVDEIQVAFQGQVQDLVSKKTPGKSAANFDRSLRDRWDYAEVGFVVSLQGQMLCPSLFADSDARRFRLENDRFLCNVETADVYWNSSPKLTRQNLEPIQPANQADLQATQPLAQALQQAPDIDSQQAILRQNRVYTKSRAVTPAQQVEMQLTDNNTSQLLTGPNQFQALVADANSGFVARFLQDQLKLLFWHRMEENPTLVYGAQMNLDRLVDDLRHRLNIAPQHAAEIRLALLNENGQPVIRSHDNYTTDWKRPFVASELGEFLPHWELAVYLLNPEKLTQSAKTLHLTLGLVIGVLVLAIGVGGWLVTSDVRRQLTLARQKTDFVSNVSHELKTPLTSIRMFAELLAEDRVPEASKRQRFLRIITAESERLTRLINNVLDFARMEQGEKQYDHAALDLCDLARDVGNMYAPHLESKGFTIRLEIPESPVPVRADRDAISQVLVNLLSNAEKYSVDNKNIEIKVEPADSENGPARLHVLDRGKGVPHGCEGRIFEQFYRAEDSLNSSIQGFGLGLTLARQIARAHGGDIRCRQREGGGSCFTLELPTAQTQAKTIS